MRSMLQPSVVFFGFLFCVGTGQTQQSSGNAQAGIGGQQNSNNGNGIQQNCQYYSNCTQNIDGALVGPWCLYDCWGIDSSDPLVPVWFPPPGETYPGTARDYVTGTCGNQYLVNGLDSLTECGYAQHGHDEKILGTYTTSFTADAKRVLPAVNVFNRSPPSSCTVATCASFPNKRSMVTFQNCRKNPATGDVPYPMQKFYVSKSSYSEVCSECARGFSLTGSQSFQPGPYSASQMMCLGKT